MTGYFVTGTDTGVGKTLVTTAMLAAWNTLGLCAQGMKPVAAGCNEVDGVWVNEDVALIKSASHHPVADEWVNPYLFREPIAPHIAAERKGVKIKIPRIEEAYADLAAGADVVLVEGAGGFLVPLDDRHDLADLAVALGLPIIMVVGMRLGCLNHALLTLEAMTARGLSLAGWVANRLAPDMAAYEENLAALAKHMPSPMLFELPYLDHVDFRRVARLLPSKRLLGLLGQ